MSDASTSVATAERSQVPPQLNLEAKPTKGISPEVRQFSEMAEVAINDGNKRTEALAGIAGWGIMGRVNGQLQEMHDQVISLFNNQKITQEKTTDLLQKIGGIGTQAQENIIPLLKNLDEAVRQEGKSGELDSFIKDLNYHYLKYDIKRLEGGDDPNAKLELEELKSDLTKAEKDRGEKKPEDDEVVKFALTIRGEKGLPEKFKDSPLEAIDDFFQHQLKDIVRSEKTRAQMAQRLGVEPDDLTNLLAVYEQGRQMERAMNEVGNEIKNEVGNEIKNEVGNEINPDSKKKLKKALTTTGGILGLLMALQMWMAMKKESSSGGQQMG